MAYGIDEKVFENDKAHEGVVKFQKRGSPLAQCIFFLTHESKTNVLQPSFVNRIISAEIPSTGNPLLREVVLKHNTHSICEEFNSSAVCMHDGICTKRFPIQFVEEKGHGVSQMYVIYRRRVS